MAYVVGTEVRISATFSVDNILTDPTTVVGSWQKLGGTATTPTVTKDSTGKYHFNILTDTAGSYHYRMEGTGLCTAAAQGSFVVLASNITP